MVASHNFTIFSLFLVDQSISCGDSSWHFNLGAFCIFPVPNEPIFYTTAMRFLVVACFLTGLTGAHHYVRPPACPDDHIFFDRTMDSENKTFIVEGNFCYNSVPLFISQYL